MRQIVTSWMLEVTKANNLLQSLSFILNSRANSRPTILEIVSLILFLHFPFGLCVSETFCPSDKSNLEFHRPVLSPLTINSLPFSVPTESKMRECSVSG